MAGYMTGNVQDAFAGTTVIASIEKPETTMPIIIEGTPLPMCVQ